MQLAEEKGSAPAWRPETLHVVPVAVLSRLRDRLHGPGARTERGTEGTAQPQQGGTEGARPCHFRQKFWSLHFHTGRTCRHGLVSALCVLCCTVTWHMTEQGLPARSALLPAYWDRVGWGGGAGSTRFGQGCNVGGERGPPSHCPWSGVAKCRGLTLGDRSACCAKAEPLVPLTLL